MSYKVIASNFPPSELKRLNKVAEIHELPPGWPTLQEQREHWLKKEQEWVGCNGGENDHLFTTNEDEYYEQD